MAAHGEGDMADKSKALEALERATKELETLEGLVRGSDDQTAPAAVPTNKAMAVAEKFAKDIFQDDEAAIATGLQVACAFIEKRGLSDEFSVFADKEVKDYEYHGVMALEAGYDIDEPSLDELRDRVTRLEEWLANAKEELAEYEAYVRANGSREERS